MNSVKVGNYNIGENHPIFFTAEIGINHNGDLKIAKELIDASVNAGCQAVKFQKRTVDVVYTPDELAAARENPFGDTNGDLKWGLEFSEEDYKEIDSYCKEKGIIWFASCWDEASVDFMEKFEPSCYKIASASLTDDNLLKHHNNTNRPIIISTGLSTMAQIDHAVSLLDSTNLILLHCTSTYPTKLEEINLRAIDMFKNKYDFPIGFSGHETGLATSVAAATLGACMIERHITLDRAMWGSDQAASVEPAGFARMVKDIRAIEKAMGDGEKVVYDSELPIIEKLRRIG